MMKLNDKLYEVGKNSKNIFTEVNDDYCLISKSMPVTDEELEQYVTAISKAKADGINIASIVDYKLIPGETSTFNTNHGVITYTRGVFLEDKAKGKSLSGRHFNICPGNEYDYSKLVLDYLKTISEYIEELETRNKAPQEVFDKLVSDCLDLEDYGLTIDPKPLNYFFHPEHGFTIIDVIKFKEGSERLSENEYFPTYIYGIVLGTGQATMSIRDTRYMGLPVSYQNRLFEVLNKLEVKIKNALFNNGIKMDVIKKNEDRNGYRFVNTYTDVNLEDMETEIVDKVRSYQQSKDTTYKKPFNIEDLF